LRRFSDSDGDVELLVEFAPIGGHGKFHAYIEILEALQSVFGNKVDLVMSGDMRSTIIKREIEKTKRPIYAAQYTGLSL
jgi:predicted nucleotidyltransferase